MKLDEFEKLMIYMGVDLSAHTITSGGIEVLLTKSALEKIREVATKAELWDKYMEELAADAKAEQEMMMAEGEAYAEWEEHLKVEAEADEERRLSG